MAIDIPVPKIVADVEAGGPLVTAMRGMNALSQQNLDTHMKRLENKYYPHKTEAEIASKQAYAKFVEPQIRAKLAQDPNFWAGLTPEQQQRFIQDTQKSLFNQNAVAQMPQPELSPFQRLMGAITGNNSQQQQAPQNQLNRGAAPNMGLQPGLPLPTRNAELQYAYSGNNYPTEGEAEGTANFNQPPAQPPGRAPNPALDIKRKIEEDKAEAKAEARTRTKEWADALRGSNKAADMARGMANAAQSFHASYKDSLYRGARLGTVATKGFLAGPTLPGKDLSNEQKADTAAVQMQNFAAKEYQQGHITNQDYQLYSRLKLDRSLDPKAEEDLYNSIVATNKRMELKPRFFNYIKAHNPGIDISEAEVLWNLFNQNAPPYDFSSFKPLDNNNKWKEFASSDAVQSMREKGEYNPASSSEDENQGQMPPKDNVWMTTPEGKQVPVHRSRIQEAQQKYKFKLVE